MWRERGKKREISGPPPFGAPCFPGLGPHLEILSNLTRRVCWVAAWRGGGIWQKKSEFNQVVFVTACQISVSVDHIWPDHIWPELVFLVFWCVFNICVLLGVFNCVCCEIFGRCLQDRLDPLPPLPGDPPGKLKVKVKGVGGVEREGGSMGRGGGLTGHGRL